jgi:hypothetical protein
MHLATAHMPVDTHRVWLETNGATRCRRLNATITTAACLANMYVSERKSTDLRCAGCGGLDNQPEPGRSFLPPVMVADPEADESLNDGFAALDEIIDRLYDKPEPGDDFNDVEVELDDEQLQALFPELYDEDDEPEPEYPRFTEHQTEMPRYAVYKGRCRKCGGYMDSIREWHVENVFHCLACGWRTSPDYEQNRMLQASGKDGNNNESFATRSTIQ